MEAIGDSSSILFSEALPSDPMQGNTLEAHLLPHISYSGEVRFFPPLSPKAFNGRVNIHYKAAVSCSLSTGLAILMEVTFQRAAS